VVRGWLRGDADPPGGISRRGLSFPLTNAYACAPFGDFPFTHGDIHNDSGYPDPNSHSVAFGDANAFGNPNLDFSTSYAFWRRRHLRLLHPVERRWSCGLL